MAKKRIEDSVEEIAVPIADRLGVDLIDVEYVKEGGGFVLRIIIDRPEGVRIEDCEGVSRELDALLDENDIIEHSYTLEVQSPGERVLKKEKEFIYFKGRDVEVKLYEAVDGRKKYEGVLLGLEGEKVVIETDGGYTIEFDKNKIASVRLKIKF